MCQYRIPQRNVGFRFLSAYHFTQQEHVLTAHEEDSTWNVGIKLSGIDPFNGILENKVRYIFAPPMRPCGKPMLAGEAFATLVFIPNWSQLRKTPINFLPSRRTRTSFSVRRKRNSQVSLMCLGRLRRDQPTICQIQQLRGGREHLRRELWGTGLGLRG